MEATIEKAYNKCQSEPKTLEAIGRLLAVPRPFIDALLKDTQDDITKQMIIFRNFDDTRFLLTRSYIIDFVDSVI
jgi:hypothetical protein